VRKIYSYGLILIFMLATASMALAEAKSKSDVSPDAAFKMLTEGNNRFVAGRMKHPNLSAVRRQQTTEKGQKPFAVVLACADSRTPVEQIFDQGIGDIFTVRDAGNIATKTDIGSIEYAVDYFETPLVVAMGHSLCGAVEATVQGGEAPPNIRAIVDFIAPALARAKAANPDKSGEALVAEVTKANVWQAMEDIYKNSPMIREKVKDSKVKMVGALYDIKSGKVSWLGPHPQQAQLLSGEAQ
jgi:carbonic anhydrase